MEFVYVRKEKEKQRCEKGDGNRVKWNEKRLPKLGMTRAYFRNFMDNGSPRLCYFQPIFFVNVVRIHFKL